MCVKFVIIKFTKIITKKERTSSWPWDRRFSTIVGGQICNESSKNCVVVFILIISQKQRKMCADLVQRKHDLGFDDKKFWVCGWAGIHSRGCFHSCLRWNEK